MKLRVRGTRSAVEKARRYEALGVDLEDPACAASREGGVVLQEIERARETRVRARRPRRCGAPRLRFPTAPRRSWAD